MMTDKDRVLLGEISGVHGIKGEVVIRSYAAAAQDIASYGPLADEQGARHFDVTVVRTGPKGVVARVAGVSDRTTAETLRGVKLYVDRDRLPAPEGNAFYHADLIGLAAVGSDGVRFGRIAAVHNYGAGDFLEVELAAGGSALVPFTDALVPEVDLANHTARIILPPVED